MRSKKRQERTEEGQSSVDTPLILDRIAVMQGQLDDRLDDLNDKIVDIQNRHSFHRTKEAYLKSQGYTLEVKPLKTLKTCVFVREVLSCKGNNFDEIFIEII
ncbi:hypothetical protein M9H77_11508 [Catharanthus roseus]|uniref:Uncharacterized protein n=1 Tax=Catharanthus roseus TaxID=4058 RepID=A0ACC0BES2_CATRO|nr:hypothetical protein M9H77_00034 [Catharanthus roseus]KAI5671144.1 hypothetical protein M9H77_11508 [Catharanthus roseus]